ncbi:MAG: hypothetical protein ACK4K9_05315 [Bacteroidia bacterium]
MKKTILSLFAIAAISTTITSCKKDDNSSNKNNNTTTPTLVGSWGSTKLEAYVVSDDRKVYDSVYTDIILFTFRTDGTFTGSYAGEAGSGTYKLINQNSKTYLVLNTVGEQPDTTQVENITATSFNFTFKEQAIADGEPYYSKIFFGKK